MRRSRTEVGLLVLPEAGHAAALGQRHDRVVNQRITVNLDWWNAALAERRLPGGPVVGVGVDGCTATGLAQISRGDIFMLARAAEDDKAALRVLWHVLAWGSGNKLRGNKRRLAAVAASPGQVGGLLRRAASLAGSHPGLAYTCFYPDDRRTAVPFLGPAFFTSICTSPVAASTTIYRSSSTVGSRRACTMTSGGVRWTVAGAGRRRPMNGTAGCLTDGQPKSRTGWGGRYRPTRSSAGCLAALPDPCRRWELGPRA